MDEQELKDRALNARKSSLAFFKKIRKNRYGELDNHVHALHQEVFKRTDCLQCANCCRHLGPRIIYRDIEQIARFLRKKNAEIIDLYLQIDEDNDYVFKQMPCPFLGSDNYCTIYAVRPKACREYPHTDRRNFHQITSLTVKNAETCPAVFEILEQLKRSF